MIYLIWGSEGEEEEAHRVGVNNFPLGSFYISDPGEMKRGRGDWRCTIINQSLGSLDLHDPGNKSRRRGGSHRGSEYLPLKST